MGFLDDLGGGANNLLMGFGDSISGKNQAEIAKLQLQNQRDALLTLEKLNTTKGSNTGLIIGIVVGVVVILGIIAVFAFKKSS